MQTKSLVRAGGIGLVAFIATSVVSGGLSVPTLGLPALQPLFEGLAAGIAGTVGGLLASGVRLLYGPVGTGVVLVAATALFALADRTRDDFAIVLELVATGGVAYVIGRVIGPVVVGVLPLGVLP